jgi:hypothetical protein
MLTRHSFEYAIIRIVPRVEREEFINVGGILFCRTRRFLDARIALDRARLAALAPQLDVAAIEDRLNHIPLVCKGGAIAGPIGLLSQPERFRWLVAPSSTIVQASPVHCGMCTDPEAALERVMATMVSSMIRGGA